MDIDLTSAYPFSGYNFCVVLDGFKLGFQTVSGLTLRNESYTAFHESGHNLTVAVHRQEKRELNHLTLTKGLGFFNPSKLMSKIHVMILMVFSEGGTLQHAYVFSPGYVERVSVSDFDAQESRLLIDTTVIAYDFAVEIDLTGRTTPVAYTMNIAAQIEAKTQAEKTAEANVRKIAEYNKQVKLRRKQEKTSSAPPIEY